VQRECRGKGPQVIASAFSIIVILYEAKLFLRKMILLLFFSQRTPLHWSAENGHLETCRLLLQCNANVEANDHE
jgi:ankyrin repeat protein